MIFRKKSQREIVGGYRPGEDGESWLAWVFDQEDDEHIDYEAFINEQAARNWIVKMTQVSLARAPLLEWDKRGIVHDCYRVEKP